MKKANREILRSFSNTQANHSDEEIYPLGVVVRSYEHLVDGNRLTVSVSKKNNPDKKHPVILWMDHEDERIQLAIGREDIVVIEDPIEFVQGNSDHASDEIVDALLHYSRNMNANTLLASQKLMTAFTGRIAILAEGALEIDHGDHSHFSNSFENPMKPGYLTAEITKYAGAIGSWALREIDIIDESEQEQHVPSVEITKSRSSNGSASLEGFELSRTIDELADVVPAEFPEDWMPLHRKRAINLYKTLKKIK